MTQRDMPAGFPHSPSSSPSYFTHEAPSAPKSCLKQGGYPRSVRIAAALRGSDVPGSARGHTQANAERMSTYFDALTGGSSCRRARRQYAKRAHRQTDPKQSCAAWSVSCDDAATHLLTSRLVSIVSSPHGAASSRARKDSLPPTPRNK